MPTLELAVIDSGKKLCNSTAIFLNIIANHPLLGDLTHVLHTVIDVYHISSRFFK